MHKEINDKEPHIKVTKNGPYLVFGNIPLEGAKIAPDAENYLLAWKETGKIAGKEIYLLCRCGQSKNAPFCDSSHLTNGFDGTETADHVPFRKKAEVTKGPGLELLDAGEYCASAHFCTRAGGTWDLVEQSDDPEKRKIAEQEVADCPSGRLVLIDKQTGQEIEPEFAPSIVVTEDPVTGTSGPLWVRGRIPIEAADGKTYELRNRVTLCRCGKSKNMPFCNSAHVIEDFKVKKRQ